jgi:hypothetical protein
MTTTKDVSPGWKQLRMSNRRVEGEFAVVIAWQYGDGTCRIERRCLLGRGFGCVVCMEWRWGSRTRSSKRGESGNGGGMEVSEAWWRVTQVRVVKGIKRASDIQMDDWGPMSRS